MAKIGDFLERHSAKVILTALILTLLLFIPLAFMANDELASEDPGGEVFDLRDDVNERFAPSIHGTGYIVESRTGDVLTQACLWELYQNEQQLRETDRIGALGPEGLPAQPYLYEAFNIYANQSFVGIFSLADAVQSLLANDPRFTTTLENATDEQVKIAIYQLFSNPDTSGMQDYLSIQAISEKRVIEGREIDYWVSPAFIFEVLADNEKLGGGTQEIGVGGGETVRDKEEFNRNIQRVLRGDEQAFRLWGVAIDVNLEANDEGSIAGFFIMLTVIAAILVAGVSLRSYWAVALTSAGLGSLMIWLKGISNLIGLKGGMVIDMIVPIAMISLGVDFALHALRRYKEEKGRGYAPGMALRAGFAGVLGPLALAMASGGIAFLANASSGIESVIQFGIAATIAMFSSFIILGVVIPLVMKHVDQFRVPASSSPSKHRTIFTATNSVSVAVFTGLGVLLLAAVSEVLGGAVLLAMIIAYVLVPLLVMRRRRHQMATISSGTEGKKPTTVMAGGWFTALVGGLARHRVLVLIVIVVITAAATLSATRLKATFDAKDFFDNKSNFVVSLDKLDEHIGDKGGEQGIVYIKGDLTDPKAIADIDQFINGIEWWMWPGTIVDLLQRMTDNQAVTGIHITDDDGNGIPDSKDQLKAAYDYIVTKGVPRDENTLAYTPAQVREVFFHDPASGQEDVTILSIGIPGSREQQNVVTVRDSLTKDLEVINDNPSITLAGLTGSPFTRLAQLDASTKTLQRSLPIAAIATLVLLIITMRSLRYAVITIIPIGLVVVWLYGLMYITGFALNYVTATIGAVSIGVGIVYSIHMTERFREEMRRASNKAQALRQAASGTGVALLASAASSIIGFAIMGFAPMPMFSSYGILTAVMIFLALAASLVVLPSLLLLVTRNNLKSER